jgi:D-threo-aldose 1-dehydrogenase
MDAWLVTTSNNSSSNVPKLSPLGFGGAAIGNLYEAVDENTALNTLRKAIAFGITYIDTAPHYGFGLSEKRIGRLLSELESDNNIVISTKVGRRLVADNQSDLSQPRQAFISPEPYISQFDYSYDAIMHSWEQSQKRLSRDKIDILYVHDIGRRTHGQQHEQTFRQFMDGGYRALESLRKQGVVGAIGLGVNEWEICREVLDVADLDILLLAGRYTLLEQDPLDTLFPQCRERGVKIVIGGPYNSGILATGVRGSGAVNYDYGQASQAMIERVRNIEDICVDYNIPLAAAALQFAYAPDVVSSVIPGINSPKRVASTVNDMRLAIPAEFWKELKKQNCIREDSPVPAAIAV